MDSMLQREKRIAIWNKRGQFSVQVIGNRVFDSRGQEIGWVSGDNIYDRQGRHVGWFMGGLLRDVYGKVLGFSEKVAPGQPHPALPREREGAPLLSVEGPRQGRPGLGVSPGAPMLGGHPPLGEAWSEFDPQEYFQR